MQQLAEQLRAGGCRVLTDEPMAGHTTFRIGGTADLFAVAADETAVIAACEICRRADAPLLIVGNGSNLLVSDKGIRGVVLQLPIKVPTLDGDRVTVSAGTTLSKLCIFACEHGLSGLEFAYGIPGTVGGGVYMNAGAYGGELSDVLCRVKVLKADQTVVWLSAEEMRLGYRHSRVMEEPMVVLEAEFRLTADQPTAIRARMDEYLSRRKEKQPLEWPSGGSFFKRPEGYFAGALIEQCGLKGYAVGGAQVSEKHAGFVINRGGATCADVMQLCRDVQAAVQEAHGVLLEREVQLIGE